MKKLAALICLCLFMLQAGAESRMLLGRVERGLIEDKKITVKLDTGAKTSSLHAIDIETFKKEDEEWVRFKLPLKKGLTELERPLIRSAKIKNRSREQFLDDEGEMQRLDERPVVEMTLCLADQQREIEVTLTDRSEFNYPLLLGRSAMEQFNVVIDPQEIYTQEPHCKKTEA